MTGGGPGIRTDGRLHLRGRLRRGGSAAAGLLALLGCGVPSGPQAGPDLPPGHFALGRAPTSGEVAALDIDVMGDGSGLPAGSGSAEAGAEVYVRLCAGCHGPEGAGGSADALVATAPFTEPGTPRAIGNYWPWAPTLFDYVRRAMPWDAPGSLTDQETWDVVAWLLERNGLLEPGAPLDAARLSAIEMPARPLFIPDDRLTSDRVR